jgi:hypothetical protein
MSEVPITYNPRPDVTPASELAVLASVYAHILDCSAKKKAAEGSGGDTDGKGASNVPAKGSIS